MNSLRLCRFLSRRITSSVHRKISTNTILLGRRRYRDVHEDPGIRHAKKLHSDDPEFLNNMQEEDLDDQTDFMNIDQAYDQHFSDLKSQKKKWRMYMKEKFFEPRDQPLMLTHNEIGCIKYLHEQDPVEWNVEALSERFPATPWIIRKVLKSKWNPKPERAKVRDTRVQKNWELYAEGKLDADPKLLEHLKKFVNRREILLEQIKNINFFLPEKKEERVWNNGEMNNILSQYERSIERLNKEQTKELESKMLSDGLKKTALSETEEKSNLEMLREKIEEVKSYGSNHDCDSFTLGKIVHNKEMTLERLQRHVLLKADAQKVLDLEEKAILESQLGVNNSKESINISGFTEKVTPNHPSLTTQEIKTLNTSNERKLKGRSQRLINKKLFQKETTVEVEPTEDHNTDLDMGEEKELKLSMFANEELQTMPLPDDRTHLLSESDIGKFFTHKNAGESPNAAEEKKQVIDVDFEDVDEKDLMDPERMKREKLYYDKEEEEIKNTPFWNPSAKKKSKVLIEFEKAPLQAPKEIHQITKADISCSDVYPERIKIPRSKQGSGLTFKVKDCYYDDDGEFLYRVPGMTN